MGGIGAFQPRPALGRHGAQEPADVPGGDAQPAQPGDHDVAEVLAHAGTHVEGFRDRGVDLGRIGVVTEIAMHALAYPFIRREICGQCRIFGNGPGAHTLVVE